MNKNELWFITGSQHLYGEEPLEIIKGHSAEIAQYLSSKLSVEVKSKGVVTTQEEISAVMREANTDDSCVGVITWMHTFSPSKMWISGLKILNKPICHFHTQYNEKIPYDSIDMDFMNINQSAHGDREHGFIFTAMRKPRKTVAGYWKDEKAIAELDVFASSCVGYKISKSLKMCRFGDNMRNVAVTEGNKVNAEMKLGWSVNYYGIGDVVEEINKVSEKEIDSLMVEYEKEYSIVTSNTDAVREQAKYEIGIKRFLDSNGFKAFTTTFEDLHGLKQLPGLAVQRLMQQGYGFGAEGDWKTAALCHILKQMSQNKDTSFMEDYTYNLEKGNEMILGAHMLEVCPSIAEGDIKVEVMPLSIGGKEDPARLIFEGKAGEAVCVSLVDLGNRFRIIAAKVECVKNPEPMPNLPVASVMWKPLPDFNSGIKAWLMAGGAHHTVLCYRLTTEHIKDLARMLDIECVVIDENTDIGSFENNLMISDFIWNRKEI